MARKAVSIELSDETRSKLQNIVNSQKTDEGIGLQAQIVLLADQGLSNKEIAQRLNTNGQRVGRWRNRFADEGLDCLMEIPEATLADGAEFVMCEMPETTTEETPQITPEKTTETTNEEAPRLLLEMPHTKLEETTRIPFYRNRTIEKYFKKDETFMTNDILPLIRQNSSVTGSEVLRKISLFGLAILFHLLLVLV
jgi:hypothetical protein